MSPAKLQAGFRPGTAAKWIDHIFTL
jgi:hypothetical protein